MRDNRKNIHKDKVVYDTNTEEKKEKKKNKREKRVGTYSLCI